MILFHRSFFPYNFISVFKMISSIALTSSLLILTAAISNLLLSPLVIFFFFRYWAFQLMNFYLVVFLYLLVSKSLWRFSVCSFIMTVFLLALEYVYYKFFKVHIYLFYLHHMRVCFHWLLSPLIMSTFLCIFTYLIIFKFYTFWIIHCTDWI